MTKVIMNVGADNNSAMSVEKNAELTLKNIDFVAAPLDANFVEEYSASHEGWTPRTCYGVYLKGNKSTDPENMTTLNFESGSIRTQDCSCVTTNGMDEPGSQVNIKGGKLETSNSHAIYMPASGEINISGGEVESINMRRGKLNISGGKISKVKYSKEEADKIGKYFDYSGFIWLGDTVAILSGSKGYIRENETDVEKDVVITKTGGTVEKSFGTDEPFTVYCIDTSPYSQNVKFIGVDASDIKIVTHDDIASNLYPGKTYNPITQTKVFVGESEQDLVQIYPELPSMETSEDATIEEGGI